MCEDIVSTVAVLARQNPNIGETEFHRKMDDMCEEITPGEWESVYCQFEIDQNALELYQIIVKQQKSEIACETFGYCPNKTRIEDASSYYATFEQPSMDYTIAIISDMHIGESDPAKAAWLSNEAVKKINALKDQYKIKMVFITGDITNSAMPDQWTDAKAILDRLTVPYFPTLGNHDVWSYNSTFEEPHPTGDVKFAKTFSEQFRNPELGILVYNNETVYDPNFHINSWFQNWELTYDNFVFYGLDWNTRQHALPGWKGTLPTANLHDFSGGTLDWFKERLLTVPQDKQIVLLQHHPFVMPPWLPGWAFSFQDSQLEIILKTIESSGKMENYWGVIAGHLHTWYNGTGDATSRQWLTEAAKVGSSITLIPVVNGEMVDFQKFFGYDY